MRHVVATLALTLIAGTSHAGVIEWADWTSASGAGAQGTIGGVGVTFAGTLSFAQLGSGTNYWTEGNPAPYTGSATVDNPPTPAEMLAFNAASTNVLTFATPLLNPVMAIVSMGQPGFAVSYMFNQPFTVLSEGQGFWGDGSYAVSGNTLTGWEMHGVIQFQGLVSQIGWNSTAENWHGFTVGAPADPVPEPGTMLLLGAGLLGLASKRRSG